MLLDHIRFRNRQSLKVEVASQGQIGQALKNLGLATDRPVIVLVGGAGGISKEEWPAIQTAMRTIADTAQNTQATIVDGGTANGIMAAIGQARAEKGHSFPLIGVAAKGTVTWPGRQQSIFKRLFGNFNVGSLDSNHTHFILVPGKNWGDESLWISQVATRLAADQPSIAILVNGGQISRDQDLPNNLETGRPVLVVKGTGRAADALADHPPETELIDFVDIDEPQSLANKLKQALQSAS
jgi:hypothetical protein